ncbi:MAG: hypothetical protein CVV51_10785 [Spirochaetae bacterium HGW-Spirochaetae-7]|jgi:tetratricopeptide (TPR) repeat protein|nr:MAG: hypothetical protein CVV51_10785 [Spirochaetae bacterium HGW-Spirochaetae-7]
MAALFSRFYERFGLNAFVQGEYGKAERWFRKLEVVEPKSMRVLHNLGVILLALGESSAAERYLLEEERLYGPAYQRHLALANLAYACGRRDDAARRYESALSDKEAAPGGEHFPTRRSLEARLETCQDEARWDRSRRSETLFMEAVRAREASKLADAAAFFEEAGLLDPTNWPAFNNAGTIMLNELRQPARAAQLFESALAMSGSAQVAYNLELARTAEAKETSR